jgi:hypothetical protein
MARRTAAPDLQESENPDEGWSLDWLGGYLVRQHELLDTEKETILKAGTESGVRLYWIGYAHILAKAKCKRERKSLMKWREERGIAHSTACEAMEFCRKAGSPEGAKGLRITEGKVKFFTNRKKPEPKTSFLRVLGDLNRCRTALGREDFDADQLGKIVESLKALAATVNEKRTLEKRSRMSRPASAASPHGRAATVRPGP